MPETFRRPVIFGGVPVPSKRPRSSFSPSAVTWLLAHDVERPGVGVVDHLVRENREMRELPRRGRDESERRITRGDRRGLRVEGGADIGRQARERHRVLVGRDHPCARGEQHARGAQLVEQERESSPGARVDAVVKGARLALADGKCGAVFDPQL